MKADSDSDMLSAREVVMHEEHAPLADLLAAVRVLGLLLASPETLWSVLQAVASVLVFYHFRYALAQVDPTQDPDAAPFASNMSWTFVSFAIAMPLTSSIGNSFKRREEGLHKLAGLKTGMLQVYTGLRWTGEEKDRHRLPARFTERCLECCLAALDEMEAYLLLPTPGRTRHSTTRKGREQAEALRVLRHSSNSSIVATFRSLQYGCEQMKRCGCVHEGKECGKFLSTVMDRWEELRKVKDYRTPQASRCYARVFILVVPWIYGPYYVYLAGVNNTGRTSVVFAIFYAVITQLVFMGLFNAQQELEDPFVLQHAAHFPDVVRVREELDELRHLLSDVDRALFSLQADSGGLRDALAQRF